MSRAEHILQKILSLIFQNFKISLFLIEKIVQLKKFKSDQPQLFILGLPRSGTTLVYQYIVHRLNVAYFTNGVGKYFLSPCSVTFFQNRIYGKYQSDFKSDYGKAQGALAPREAGAFWGRFFGFENYIRYAELSSKDIRSIRNTIACVQYVFGNKPFVNKNVKHMLRIDALSKIFPNSYFLIVERNWNDVALSNIRARYKPLSNPKEWWSVKPQNYSHLKNLPITHQVFNQLITLKKKLERDLAELPLHRIIRVKYEEFCKQPESLINALGPCFISSGYRNQKRLFFDQSINQPQNQEEDIIIKLIELENEYRG